MARKQVRVGKISAFDHELRPLAEAVASRRMILFFGGVLSQNLGLPDFKALVQHIAADMGFQEGNFSVADYSVIAEAYMVRHAQLGALRSWKDTTWHPPSVRIQRSELHNLIVDLDFQSRDPAYRSGWRRSWTRRHRVSTGLAQSREGRQATFAQDLIGFDAFRHSSGPFLYFGVDEN